MTGYKTFLFGLLLAIGGPALAYFAHFDWTTVFGGGIVATAISGVAVIALRWFTTTPMFQSAPPSNPTGTGTGT